MERKNQVKEMTKTQLTKIMNQLKTNPLATQCQQRHDRLLLKRRPFLKNQALTLLVKKMKEMKTTRVMRVMRGQMRRHQQQTRHQHQQQTRHQHRTRAVMLRVVAVMLRTLRTLPQIQEVAHLMLLWQDQLQ